MKESKRDDSDPDAVSLDPDPGWVAPDPGSPACEGPKLDSDPVCKGLLDPSSDEPEPDWDEPEPD
jgi:hypothetical protein